MWHPGLPPRNTRREANVDPGVAPGLRPRRPGSPTAGRRSAWREAVRYERFRVALAGRAVSVARSCSLRVGFASRLRPRPGSVRSAASHANGIFKAAGSAGREAAADIPQTRKANAAHADPGVAPGLPTPEHRWGEPTPTAAEHVTCVPGREARVAHPAARPARNSAHNDERPPGFAYGLFGRAREEGRRLCRRGWLSA